MSEGSRDESVADTPGESLDSARPRAHMDAWTGSIAQLSLDWIADDRVPRLFVDEALVVAWLNASARRELALRRCLQLRNETLTTTDPAAHDKLLTLLRESRPVGTVAIRGADGEGHVVIHAQRLDYAGAERLFGIKFHRIGHDFKPVYVGMDTAFGFTAAEQRVLVQLVNGDSLPTIAKTLRVSVETIRTHVRNIYAKTEVSSRAELFSLVRAFRL